MSIKKELFGKLSDGREVYSYTLQNRKGMKVKLIELGAAIVEICVPDMNGTFSDVVCGYDSLYGYENGDGAQGAVVGRWANRIAKGCFKLDGKEYHLLINNGENHLHGGKENLAHKVWTSESVGTGAEPAVKFSCFSPDGEEGYPGNLSVSVTYTLTKDNALKLSYYAVSDKKTVLNLTNHSYFNLGGFASGDVLDHELWVDADTYLETDGGLIPTGRKIRVSGTPFDFTKPKKIGTEINADNRDLKIGTGYDHCFNFTVAKADGEIKLRATLYSNKTGRFMEMYTNQPCVQIYTANFMTNAKFPLKGGCLQHKRHAVCLETQRMPDSMNHKGFTKATLDKGEVYDYTTIYKFSVKKD